MKFSLGKTAFALAIVNLYLLVFSTVGSMESIPDRDILTEDGLIIDKKSTHTTKTRISSNSVDDDFNGGVPVTIFTGENAVTTPPFTQTSPQDFTNHNSTPQIISSTNVPILTTIASVQTAPPSTTVPTTTPPAATTPPPTTTTAPPTTPNPVITTPPPVPVDNDVFNEKLTVYDKLTGKYVTDKAYNLVCQNVLAEMHPSYFKPEAIKAQAVAAYNHIKYKQGTAKLPLKGFETLNGYNESVRKEYQKKIEDAVSSVLGQMMYINGKAIDAAYFASSAGTTLSAKDVWGGYLAGHERVLTPFDEKDPNYGLSTFINASDMAKIFAENNISLSGNAKEWLNVKSYITGKYVHRVKIGQNEISGTEFRDILSLKSSAFEIKFYEETNVFVIKTYGFGHGVGLSQHGAQILAGQGKNYKDILKTYYTGIIIK